jgi:Zn-dependent M28 family amino/carboxypeptidase
MVYIFRIILLFIIIFILYAGVVSMLCLFGKAPKQESGPYPAGFAEREDVLSDELRSHVDMLAARIGDRNYVFYKNLEQAAAYIEQTLSGMGYATVRQEFSARGQKFSNIIAERRGCKQPGQVIIIGAHYDCSLGSEGADDNGSGVAALLALARAFSAKNPGCTVRFAFFPNEEPPFFWTSDMGSYRYAELCRRRGDAITAMISLEMLGFYSDEPGSQSYIFPINLFFPDTGNFIGFVSNLKSRSLLNQAVRAFRRGNTLPSEGVALPWFIPGVFWSDHWPFWEHGYPAIMVTDTAFFRNPHYHEPTDLPATLDYGRLARVTAGLEHMIEELAGR